MSRLRTAALAVKLHDPASLALARAIAEWLEGHGARVFSLRPEDQPPLPVATDLALSVGGDGSVISVARRLAGQGIPLAGINTGRVGFLTEFTASTWQEGLAMALNQGWQVEKRLGISLQVTRAGKEVFSLLAVNEVVISRGGFARLPAFELEAGASRLISLRADGIIIASPTGATAYSSSSGGPLLYPTLQAYSVTAICPFQTRFPPLVLEAATELRITLRESDSETFATVDGQEFFPLQKGDRLTLRGRPEAILLARFGLTDYFSKLRSTGFIADSPGTGRLSAC